MKQKDECDFCRKKKQNRIWYNHKFCSDECEDAWAEKFKDYLPLTFREQSQFCADNDCCRRKGWGSCIAPNSRGGGGEDPGGKKGFKKTTGAWDKLKKNHPNSKNINWSKYD